ncbi:hypothetical protein IJG98_02410 [Candidatus Saccharibacteria bacterium]|nr:hypothetical protein [Candidatus Saccharibacteria bacterium]
MHKVKLLSALTLAIFATFFLATKSSARQLTPTERQTYAQNNILFYVPCDTLEDCEPEETEDQDAPFSGDPTTVPGEGAEKIVNFAIKASWPNESGQCRDGSTYTTWYNVNNPEGCKSTINDFARNYGFTDGYNPPKTLQDCGRFVGFVLRNTVDSGASDHGTYSQSDHFDATPSKWTKVSTDGQVFPEAQLQPGDILVFGDRNGGSADGHIKIYIGDHTVKCGNNSECKVNVAQASWKGRTPYLSKQSSITYYSRNQNKYYTVYRYIGS